MQIEEIVDGEIVRHIHMVSFVKGGQRLEVVYSDNELTTATLTSVARGKHVYLNKEERDAIVEQVRDRIGVSEIISY